MFVHFVGSHDLAINILFNRIVSQTFLRFNQSVNCLASYKVTEHFYGVNFNLQ